MKLYNIKNVEEFLDIIDGCKGTVELVSKEGDRLNLKSQLSKYVAINKIFNNDVFIHELELIAYEKEDLETLFKYLSGTQFADVV